MDIRNRRKEFYKTMVAEIDRFCRSVDILNKNEDEVEFVLISLLNEKEMIKRCSIFSNLTYLEFDKKNTSPGRYLYYAEFNI